jgi:FMN-dependent oxidoreductase (nitrilotriacetate monooxygenase family)
MTDKPKRQMKLGVFANPTGNHVASWRHPDAQADAGVNFAHYAEIAQTAERAKFDMIFLSDNICVREAKMEALSRSAQYVANFEPLTLLSALSVVTSRIGLVATASTSYNEPYHVARKFASLDHLSNGRAGWNLVTSALGAEAPNFGREVHFDHRERYQRAHEFATIVTGLWDSWDDDAFVRDKETGRFFKPDSLHTLHHKGEFFSVKGPLNVARTPQGWPVIVQAGGSEDMMAVAAEFAEVIFCAPLTFEAGKTFYDKIKDRAASRGRAGDTIKVLPGLAPIVGRTDAEAAEKARHLESLTHPIVALEILSTILGGIDFSRYDIDAPFPDDLPATTNASQFVYASAQELARRENLSLREVALRMAGARGKNVITGTPHQVADMMEEWFVGGAADGFNILPSHFPGGLNDFVELVVPELQRRGLFRTEYEGVTMRENLGLARPQNRYVESALPERTPIAV